MAFEFAGLSTGVRTQVAPVRLFAGMGTPVDDQIALEPEAFPAKLAGFCFSRRRRRRAGASVVVVIVVIATGT